MLLVNVDAIEEHSRIFSSNFRRILDVRSSLTDIFKADALHDDVFALDHDFGGSHYLGFAWTSLPSKVCNSQVLSRNFDGYWKVGENNLQFEGKSCSYSLYHVLNVRTDSSHECSFLFAGPTSLNGYSLTVQLNIYGCMRKVSGQFSFFALNRDGSANEHTLYAVSYTHLTLPTKRIV